MIGLVWAIGCGPRVHVAWTTHPEVAVDEPLVYVVVDEAGHPDVRQAVEETLERSGRLGEGCDVADARVRVTDVATQERVGSEALNAESLRYVVPDADGGERVVVAAASGPRATATWEGRVHLTWTVERCDGDPIESLTGTVAASRVSAGETADGARASLPEGLLKELVRSSGYALGRRLVPTSGRVSRRWYRAGDPRLRLATAAVRAGHWDAAASTWSTVIADREVSDRVRGRAFTNLAVLHELRGQYARAFRAVTEAQGASPASAILRYRQDLERTWTGVRSLRKYEPLEIEEASTP